MSLLPNADFVLERSGDERDLIGYSDVDQTTKGNGEWARSCVTEYFFWESDAQNINIQIDREVNRKEENMENNY